MHALHQVGSDGISADLRVLPMERFFADQPSDGMIIDPVLLDGAGQLCGAWLHEQVINPGIHFPVQFDELTFYGPPYPSPMVLRCLLRVVQYDYRHLRANLEVVGPDGRVHIGIAGWQHYVVHVPTNRIRLSHGARNELSGERWDIPTVPLPARGHYVASLVDGLSEKGSGSMEQASAHVMLSAAEREQWRAHRGPASRRVQWLLGRIAAKDAVRAYLARQYGLSLYPADVEVVTDAHGRPRVQGAWAADIPTVPAVSLAHDGMIGVGIAGGDGPDDYLGIDIERVLPRDDGFLDLAFSARERTWLRELDESARWEWVTRFWCAKEAMGKAVGYGLEDGPSAVSIERVDWDTGRLVLMLGDSLGSRLPELAGERLLVYTARAEELAVASTICERAEPMAAR
jgi:phosphopantetheinyl transferase